jgi:hypothetical protein
MSSLRPTGLFAEKVAIQENVELKQVQKKFKTTDELIYHVTHNTNNILHKDGRIYLKITAKGELFAQSISPFSKTFFENIEPKIKELIKALVNKRYLTYSSCEGHDLSFRRYVGLAFMDEESREHLVEEIKKLKLPGLEYHYKDSVANCPIEFNEKGNYTYKNKIVPAQEINEQEVHAFNIQFHRHYERYYFLELVILKAVPKFEGKLFSFNFLKWIIKNIPLIFAKKVLVEFYTKKITELIKSNKVKKYKY